jgi:hypothetical protein
MNNNYGEHVGVSIRNPSTANFLIDSNDRNNFPGSTTAANFTISKKNSLFNGYFTRIGVSEFVLDWNIPNVYDLSGVSQVPASVTVAVTGQSTYTVTVPVGTYNVAQALNQIVVALNAVASPAVFSITKTANTNLVSLTSTVGFNFTVANASNSSLVNRLGFSIGVTSQNQTISTLNSPSYGIPNLRTVQYLDIVCNQLTYNQELKDASTSQNTQDILTRYYFANDTIIPSLDQYGFQIFPEYNFFVNRREFPFPKQIKWDPTQPIGQLQFQVYAKYFFYAPEANNAFFPDDYALVNGSSFNWKMTLLVSEV